MKIYKVLFGLELLSIGAHAGYVQGDKIKSHHHQGLQRDNVFVDCAWPCSLGSCQFDDVYPWNYVDNGRDVWQEFRFTLEEGTTYNITLKRDPTQCKMEPSRLLYGNSGFNAQEQFHSFVDGCGPTERWAITPSTTDLFTFTVTMNHAAAYQGDEDCPREGFKYSVVIDPLPLPSDSDYVDPTCYDPPQRSFVKGSGTFDSRAGSSRHDPALTGEVNFAFKIKHNDLDDNGQIIPNNSFHDSFMTKFNFDAANLHFVSTSYKWLFNNEREGCARFQGTGLLDDGAEAIFDVIAFDEGVGSNEKDNVEIYIYESMESGFRGPLIYHSYGRPHKLSSGEIEVSNCKGTEREGCDLLDEM
mmetsp:Transcript_1122/g.1967  ORF Transcript_1122/g.1967 Transcript_1122/m.1967 type:complete len:357 (-) Transcript_1122:303-1373(-)|eukprot:CAMPEP_0183751170 /NCGR_PEP_ID=MMETSP0739-20130205/1585_1 /TAXON_ID=385413 /ORGANISM="Thalassiosira miniscula, Strain CCMP1093" /LENGTH=356 /DNA_ID=CAMNT_0025987371 /DNA_START=242 /DNA_END=1312 /DNA_ORIENTATION=-